MSIDVTTGTDTVVADESTHEDTVAERDDLLEDDLLEDELLVEEVSIDGMCGVY